MPCSATNCANSPRRAPQCSSLQRSGDRVIWATPAGAAQLGVGAPAALDDLVFGSDGSQFSASRNWQRSSLRSPEPGSNACVSWSGGGRDADPCLPEGRALVANPFLSRSRLGEKRPFRRGGIRFPFRPRFLTGGPDPFRPRPPRRTDKELTIESLRTRAGGRQIVRFVWQVDEQGRFAAPTAELAVLVGDERHHCPGRRPCGAAGARRRGYR